MNKQFIFKYDNLENWAKIRLSLDAEMLLKECTDIPCDFQVEIKPLNSRSKNALKAYWVLIGSIVKWDANNNGYKQRVWDEWFKKEAGLIEEIDMIPLIRMRHSSSPYGLPDKNLARDLGLSWYITRSISNKGDVTKEEMERLINCVLKFGAENNVPNCEIINTELDKLLEFYD